MPQLILGAIRGETLERLAPFLASLRATGFPGDVVLCDFGCPEATREALAREGVALERLPDARLADERLFPFAAARILAAREVVRANRGGWDRILVADVRDLVFQADPFAADTGPGLASFLEDEGATLGREPELAAWIAERWDPEEAARLSGCPVASCAAASGSRAAVLDWLEKLSAEILASRAIRPLRPAAAQAIHNRLLWSRALDDVTVFPNGGGNVLSLARADPREVRLDDAGRVLNADGTLPALLHRADRLVAPGRAPSALPAPPLRLSVVVPTYGRPERIARLLERLDGQTLDPRAFEVVVVDDGSPEPVALDAPARRFALKLLRQENAGPAAARNLGVAHASAELVLFLNDDAVPHDDLLELHLAAHAAAAAPVAVMGAFPFTQRALREPFTRLLAESSLLFDFASLRHGELHGWTFFWTCNISLRRSLLVEIGGFDADTFREAIVEDVELGYRLEKAGVKVLYRGDAVCEHEHPLRVDDYFRRAARLGANVAKMWKKHRDPTILWAPPGSALGREYLMAVQQKLEAIEPEREGFLASVRRWSEGAGDGPLDAAERSRLAGEVRRISVAPALRGIVTELTGADPVRVMESGPARGKLTSLVLCSYNALEKTRSCLESLRRAADPDHPAEILFVDNGSTDGSAEWLAEQRDVRLVRNAENAGAPRARNQALALARGETVGFLDNDIVVTPGWLGRMLYHLEVDPLAGCVGACADRASHEQQVDYEGPADPASLARFAEALAAANARRARLRVTLASFCILVKRATLDRIGGFDERFSPWGFEDDDFTLRAYLAGHHSRVALDVFVHHDTYAGPKHVRHQRLLLRNWRRFTEKFGLGKAPYGDLSGMEGVLARTWTEEELFSPFAEAGSAAA
jgi:GT2 family glycosyltransferase